MHSGSCVFSPTAGALGDIDIGTCSEDPVGMPKALAALAGQALKRILDYLKHSDHDAVLTASRQAFGLLDDGKRLTHGRGGQVFSVAGYPTGDFGEYRMVAQGLSSNKKLLNLREKGVYSSYTPGTNVRHFALLLFVLRLLVGVSPPRCRPESHQGQSVVKFHIDKEVKP